MEHNLSFQVVKFFNKDEQVLDNHCGVLDSCSLVFFPKKKKNRALKEN